MNNVLDSIDFQKLLEFLTNVLLGTMAIVPMILSALIAVFLRNLFEWFKDIRKSKRAKKLLILEVKDNMSHLKSALITLEVLGKDLNIMNMSEETFMEFKNLQSSDFIFLNKMMKDADRHLNLISVIVYKEIFLKLNRNFNSNEDEFLHSIYFHILKIENYKAFLNEVNDKESKQFFEVYFKISELSNLILKLSDSKDLSKLFNTKTIINNFSESVDSHSEKKKD